MVMCDILDELFSKCEMVSGFDCQVEAMLIHAVDGGVGTGDAYIYWLGGG